MSSPLSSVPFADVARFYIQDLKNYYKKDKSCENISTRILQIMTNTELRRRRSVVSQTVTGIFNVIITI